jgi:hypothetical protein
MPVARLKERGATEEEVISTVRGGERFPAKFGRVGFRRNFVYNATWRGWFFATKQVEAIAVEEDEWVVITAIVRYF